MVLTGARWSAHKALEAGLVSEVVPLNALMTRARLLAEKVLALGPLAVRLTKMALNASMQMPLAAGLLYESTAQAITFESRDKVEGTTAFLEKRQPQFKGD
jgi:enoyl-CoA hydratase